MASGPTLKEHTMRRLVTLIAPPALIAVSLALALANTFTADPLEPVSKTPSPFATCTADHIAQQLGVNFPNSTVEPWVDVNPTNPLNIVATWQQDRWSNGGSRGLVAGVSTDGGVSWTSVVIPRITACSGNPDFTRASDPWLSFAPNGHLYHVSLSITVRPDGLTAPSALLVSKSVNGGATWGNPITVKRDDRATVLNDKESITADPDDANLVYLVWDRLESPNEQASDVAFEHALGFRGPTWFSRTTNGGTSWEPARLIFDPGEINQTIGNQIVVLPNGDLIDVFNLIFNHKNAHKVRGFNVALLRSTDKGVSWSGPIIVSKLLTRALFDPQQIGVRDPDTGDPVRTGDIIPEVAVDRSASSPAEGNLYIVWQDSRFSNFAHDSVAFSKSTNGGLTWSTPIQINRTPTNIPTGNQQAFTPAIRVAADGTIAVTYYDFRNNTSDPTTLPTDAFVVHCHASAAAASCTHASDWASETQLTPTSIDMRKAPVARGFFLGDYEALTVVGPDFRPVFVTAGPTKGESSVMTTTVGP
jgi:hypothetical protein